jgi:hypothetical protein
VTHLECGSDFGFAFVELPAAQVVLSGAELSAEETYGEGQEDGSEFHL